MTISFLITFFISFLTLSATSSCSGETASRARAPYIPGPKEVVKIVDPDNGPGTDYTSLEEFARREKRDLVSAGEIAVALCRSSKGSPDRPAQFDHWITDREHYVKVVADAGHRAGGKWDESKYRIIERSDLNSECIDVEIDNIVIDGIQMMLIGSGRSQDIIDPQAGDLLIVKNCYMRIALTSGSGDAIDLKSEAYLVNNIMECSVEDSGRLTAIVALKYADVKVYNNTIIGFYRGFKNEGKIIAVNNIIRGATEGFVAHNGGVFSDSSDYNSSNIPGDALVKTPRGNATPPWYNGDIADEAIFMDAANYDYRLKPGAVFIGAGIGRESDPDVPAENMEGESRSAKSVNLGAF